MSKPCIRASLVGLYRDPGRIVRENEANPSSAMIAAETAKARPTRGEENTSAATLSMAQALAAPGTA